MPLCESTYIISYIRGVEHCGEWLSRTYAVYYLKEYSFESVMQRCTDKNNSDSRKNIF